MVVVVKGRSRSRRSSLTLSLDITESVDVVNIEKPVHGVEVRVAVGVPEFIIQRILTNRYTGVDLRWVLAGVVQLSLVGGWFGRIVFAVGALESWNGVSLQNVPGSVKSGEVSFDSTVQSLKPYVVTGISPS